MQHTTLTLSFLNYVAAPGGQCRNSASVPVRPGGASHYIDSRYTLGLAKMPTPTASARGTPTGSEKQHSNGGNVLDPKMHGAARAWPLNAQDSGLLLGTGSGDRRSEDTQLRRRNAQRLLLGGNAGALRVFRFEQQLLAALDLRPLWIPVERELLFSQSPWWFFIGAFLPRVASNAKV